MPLPWSNVLVAILLLFCSCVVASPTSTLERRENYIEPEKTGEKIVYEWSGGEWKYETLTGNYRFVITQAYERGPNRLYVQWWRELESSEKELSYSLSIKEINSIPTYSFSTVVCAEEKETCDTVLLKTKNMFEEYDRKIKIKLRSLGRYELTLM